MKKLIAILTIFVLLVSSALAVSEADKTIDLDLMTFTELVALRNKINMAIWNSQEWEEVTVPEGIWEIGADIPAGKWTIEAHPKGQLTLTYGKELKEGGNKIDYFGTSGGLWEIIYGEDHIFHSEGESTSITLNLDNGWYLEIDGCSATFTPYAGAPAFQFK